SDQALQERSLPAARGHFADEHAGDTECPRRGVVVDRPADGGKVRHRARRECPVLREQLDEREPPPLTAGDHCRRSEEDEQADVPVEVAYGGIGKPPADEAETLDRPVLSAPGSELPKA